MQALAVERAGIVKPFGSGVPKNETVDEVTYVGGGGAYLVLCPSFFAIRALPSLFTSAAGGAYGL